MAVAPVQRVDVPVLTAAGREDLRNRLDHSLQALADVAERMSGGERTAEEVATYHRLLKQVEQLTAVVANTPTVAAVDEDPTIVEVGDEVVVEMPDGELDTYAVVHPIEAKAAEGRVSIAAPLGRALLGARPGDRIIVEAPAGAYSCTVRARRRLA